MVLTYWSLKFFLENRCKTRKYLPNKISNWIKDAKWWWTKWNGVQGYRKDNHTGLTINIIQLLDGYQIKISIKGQESSRIEDTICQGSRRSICWLFEHMCDCLYLLFLSWWMLRVVFHIHSRTLFSGYIFLLNKDIRHIPLTKPQQGLNEIIIAKKMAKLTANSIL